MGRRPNGSNGPAANEVEVSVFGPGKGESIAVHLCDGEWIIVDSCVEQRTGRIPVLEYLGDIGVSVTDQVRLVVGTHAHDDHIAGLGQVFSECTSAKFVSSVALTSEEFYEDLEADADIEVELRQSIRREYQTLFDEVERRGIERGLATWLAAKEQAPLYRRAAGGDIPDCSITALSPSDHAILRSRRLLAQGSGKVGSRRRLRASDPNEFAVALWVQIGDVEILLGADLLIGPSGCGWGAVLASHSPRGVASLHKVPHHGSPNAHHDGVWSNLLSDDVLSVLAPFRGGQNPRPNPDDVSRISDLSGAVYASAPTKQPQMTASERRTAAQLQSIAVAVRAQDGLTGHVRARRFQGADGWTVETFGPALKYA